AGCAGCAPTRRPATPRRLLPQDVARGARAPGRTADGERRPSAKRSRGRSELRFTPQARELLGKRPDALFGSGGSLLASPAPRLELLIPEHRPAARRVHQAQLLALGTRRHADRQQIERAVAVREDRPVEAPFETVTLEARLQVFPIGIKEDEFGHTEAL